MAKRVKRLLSTQKQYLAFCEGEGIPAEPASALSVSCFLVWFVEKQKGRTASVRGKLSQLRCASREFNSGRELLTMSDELEVAKIVKVLMFHDWSEVRRMEPITTKVLAELATVRASGSVVDLLILMLYTVPQNGLLRSGELVSKLKGRAVERRDGGGFGVRLGRTKTSRTGRGPKVEFFRHPGGGAMSAVALEKEWRKRTGRGASSPDDYWLPELVWCKGEPVDIDWSKSITKRSLVAVLRLDIARVGRDPLRYGGHSFRAGGATDLFASGLMTHAEVMSFGRWKTLAAALIYFRADLAAARKSARVFGHLASQIPRQKVGKKGA